MMMMMMIMIMIIIIIIIIINNGHRTEWNTIIRIGNPHGGE